MLLAIDVGNTNVKLGVYDGNTLKHSWKISTDVRRTTDEYAAGIKQLFAAEKLPDSAIGAAIISSVIPQLNYTFEHCLTSYFGVKPLIISSGIKTGLNIKYDNPKKLGADRIITSVAAIKKYGAPLILVDFGTATTFNVINSKGEFLGGVITIGIKSAMEALAKCTAQLPQVEIARTKKVIGVTTAKCIQSGITYGAVGQVKYLLEKIKQELGEPDVKVIATGGLAQIVQDELPLFQTVDRMLSLEGLNIIYRLNRA